MQALEGTVEAAQIIRIKENLVKLYSMMTGQTTEQVIKDLDRDNFMSAQEACDYGIIDKIVEQSEHTMGDDRIRPEDVSTLSRGLG